jgi:hypothetical protein
MNTKDCDWPVTVTVFEGERYDSRWMPECLPDAISWLQGLLKQVPDKYRHKTQIEIDSVGSWEDSHYPSITISYRRPPTGAEIQERIAEEKQRNEARLDEARLQYERLKALFEQEAS